MRIMLDTNIIYSALTIVLNKNGEEKERNDEF